MSNAFNLKVLVLFLIAGIFSTSASGLQAAETLIEKGIAEYRAENYEEALDLLLKAADKEPVSSETAYYLGLTYKEFGNHKEAARFLAEAATLTPPVKDAYVELIDAFYNMGELSKAKEWIEKAEKENIKPANTAFLSGLVLLKEGENEKAISAFRKAKEADKAFAQAADYQIAVAYANDRRLEEARDGFRAVIAIDPATDFALYAKEYEASIARLLESYRKWRFNAGLSYQYDDNVVLKPSTAIPAVEITGEKDSSIVASFRADYSPLLSGPWFFSGQYAFYANTYFNTTTHSLITQNISLMPGYMHKRVAITFPMAFMYAWLQEKEYMSYASARPTLSLSFSGGSTAQFSLGYAKRDMLQASSDPDEDRDADIYSLSLGYFCPLAQDKGMFNARYEFSREAIKGRNWDNTGSRLDLSVLVHPYDKLRLTITGGVFLQDYQNTHSVFEVKRKDTTYTGGAVVSRELYKDLNLNLQYSYTRADSNIALYDYSRNVFTTGVDYSF